MKETINDAKKNIKQITEDIKSTSENKSNPKININRYTGSMLITTSINKKIQYECTAKEISKEKLF